MTPPTATQSASRPAVRETGASAIWAFIKRHPRAMLVALCLTMFLPGMFSLPPLDRDESRFAQASKQMLETGDYVNIRFLRGARNKKPAGIHWMQAASAALAGGPEKAGIWAYRVPSALGALIAVLLLYWAGRRLFDDETALIAAGLLGASMALIAETNISKTDGVLIATVIAMQAVLIKRYLHARGANRLAETEPGLWHAVLFWVALSVSILIKGPIAPMVIGLTIVAISLADKDWSWLKGLRPAMGTAIVLALCLPWGLAIWFETSGVYYEESIGKDLAAKVLSAQESHGAPPGYYLALVTLTFFPGSLFLWPAVRHAWRERLDPAIRYCLAWAIPTWIAFECFPTKLPHYSLPAYPALALMTAAAIALAMRGKGEVLTSALGRVNLAVWTLLGLTLATFASLGPVIYGEGLRPWSLPLSLLGAGLVFTVTVFALRRRFLAATGTAVIAAAVLFGSILEITLPNLDRLKVSPRLTAAVETHYGEDHLAWPVIASTGFVEPSLVFLTATTTRLVTPHTAAEHLRDQPDGIAMIEARKERKFRARLDELGIEVEAFDKVEGHNYSNGQDVSITLYRRAGATAD